MLIYLYFLVVCVVMDINENILFFQSEIIDLDIGENKNHTFVQSRPLVVYPDSLSQSIGSTPFKFFSNGTLKTNTYFQADMNGYFLMSVQAKDKDMQLANATLRVGSLMNLSFIAKLVLQRIFYNYKKNLCTPGCACNVTYKCM